MLLTSWIRAVRQSFTRHRWSRARRLQAESRRQNLRHARLAEVLEERSLMSIKPLVIDINAVTGTNVFTSTASTPGINITNSLLDPNNDGISDYDDLLIGVSQSALFESTVISGAGVGIRINLSNLVGLNHIAIDNVSITAGANQQGISITLDNVALQSLAIDQTNVTPAAGTGASGLDINLKNMSSTTGIDVSVQNSNIRSGSANFNGVNVTLESVSKATHIGELTLSDSTVEGFAVSTSANSILYATIDQASARNNRIQDGAANPNARGISYTLNRTTVGDLRIEDNLSLRNVAITATNSPLRNVSISDNANFNVAGFVATDTIRDAIRVSATSTNAVGTQRSDVTNLRIVNNTITGSLANANAVNGIVLNMNDSNLGDFAVASAGARIAGNTIQNLSGTANNPAAAISVLATASSAFVLGNAGRPLLLDFDGDGTANDTNGITQNRLTSNNGRGFVATGRPDTTFLADITNNTIDGGAAPNRREGVAVSVAVKPTLLTADSFFMNFSDNVINLSQGSALSVALQDSAVGAFVIRNNEITNTTAFPVASTVTATTPNGLSLVLEGTNTNQEALNLLKASVIEGNFIGITRPTIAIPNGVAGPNAANGIFINSQEASEIRDLQILNNTLRNNNTADTQAGLQFLREDKSVLRSSNLADRAVTITGNTISGNRNGILLDARNGSVDLLDFELRDNFIGTDSTGADLGNTIDGISLISQADARLLVDMDNNQIRFNDLNGIRYRDVVGNFAADKRQLGGVWTNNTISDNTQNGVFISGRHGLSDETTGIRTPLVIGREGQGNDIENNGNNGIRIEGTVTVTTGQQGLNGLVSSTATGEVAITNNSIRANGRTGLFVFSAAEKLDIRHNQIEANVGKGIDIQVVHGIPTQPTNDGEAGDIEATIRDNVITGQINGVEQGDGIELSSFETQLAIIGFLANNAALNRLDVLALNNFIDSNQGRGVDVLNIGNGTMQLRFGDNTNQNRNTIVGNLLDGFRVINTIDDSQPQDGVPINNNNPNQFPNLGTPVPVTDPRRVLYSPDIMLDVARNTIRDNGIAMPAPRQSGGISDINGTGLVILAAGVGSGTGILGGPDGSFAATHPNEVGNNSGDPLAGNGRVNLRVTDNQFEGNFGNDVSIVPYIAAIPPQTTVSGDSGDWPAPPTAFVISNMWLDPLVRINSVMTGNSGNGLDVIRPAPDYINDESWFKSRTLVSPTGGATGGPFATGAGTRPRNATRLASDGTPGPGVPGFSFVYPGLDQQPGGRSQSGNASLSAQPTTLRVEAGFDRSGTVVGPAFFDQSAVGPGSEDNFDDPVFALNGRVDTIWDTVAVGSFTYPNVDSPTTLTVDILDFATPRSTTPGVVTFSFSEYVRFVDISDFRLLRNGVVVPLESAPGVPLPVSPVLASQDPNSPGTFSQYRVNLTAVTSISGDYQLQVLAVDSSNPTFTPIRDTHLQLTNQGNTLVRVIDGDGVLQDYALNDPFRVDAARPVGTISPITPDPRNAAAGIVTVTFNEDVSGIDIADFELRRNDGVTTQLVNLGSIGVTQVNASQYTLNLNQLSGAPGTYELRLISTDVNTPVLDLAGNLVAESVGVGIASSDTWFVDTTLPFVNSIADSLLTTTIASPVNVHPGSIIINFSEAVSGVDNNDFTLLLTSSAGTISQIDISSALTFPLFQLAANQYELNLLALAAAPGTYGLTINPLNSGIVDTAGNAFLTSFSTAWVLDVQAPLADVVDIAPDPRQTPVDALNTIFSEAVNGVNLANAAAQYVLSFDDGTAATAGSITDATNGGPIVVSAAGHGLVNGDRITVFGVTGNTNANGVFTVQNVAPGVSFELTGSVGNGIYTGGGRWVRTVSLAGLTISQQTDTRFVVNLSSITLNQGIYILSLLADGTITDDAGNAVGPATGQFNVAAQDIWTNGPDAAPTGTITTITTPRGTNAGVVTVTFSEPLQKINGLSPVDFRDFKLTRGVTTISLVNVPITQTGPLSYSLDLSGSGLTDVDGTYTLQLLNGNIASPDTVSPLKDLTGNPLSDDSDALTAIGIASQVVWVKDGTLSGPQVTSFIDEVRANNLGSITKLRAVQTLTINFSEDVTGIDLTDASKNFLLTRQAPGGIPIPVSLDLIAVQQVTAKQYRIGLSTLTGTDGTYRFTVLANGLITNTAAVPVELKNPQTVTWTKDGILRPSTVGDSTDSNQGNEVVGSGTNYSLRQAIQEANALAGDDIIELGAGTFTLSLAGVQEDLAAVGDLDIRQNLVIRGRGVGVTILDATALANQVTTTNRDRLFQILAGVTVTIQGVTVQKGAVTGSEDGGAIRNAGTLTILDSLIQNSTSQDDGGAINNTGTLTIDRTTISGNTSVATGGAIRNAGTLLLNNSTLSDNRTTSASGHGGGLMNVATFSATLENVTVSGNTALNAAGGGIRNDGTLRLINDTIAFNKSLTAGGGISRNLGTVTIGNTIVSDNLLTNNTANDAAGTYVSLGGNLVRTLGTALGFTGPGDQLNVNPNLQPLGSNGGPTRTHALPAFDVTGLINNPAIDRGLRANVTNQNDITSLDQRGALRFLDGPNTLNAVDVGAFEFGTFFVNTTDDSRDVAPGDGLAEDGLRQTSLRAAIMESNSLAGESAIMLDGQVYSLKRLAPDTVAPSVASITGVPLAPITTGGVGVVTITFSERVAGFDLAHINFTRTVGAVVTPIALPAATFQLTKVSDLIYKIENKADITANVANTGLTSVTQTNGLYELTINQTANVLINNVPTLVTIRDIENQTLRSIANVNWVRGTDTFAPRVSVIADSSVVALGGSDFITNGGTVTVTFSEKVTGVSANNFTLTRNGTAVTGLVVTPTTDNNFAGRTVVTLNLSTLTAGYGNYVLTLNPAVGANVTIKDSANINLPAGGSINWAKAAGLRFEPINDPRVDEVTKLRLQFTERVAGVKLEDFTLTFDDGSGIPPQPVDLTLATLATLGTVTAVPNFGNAAEQWELTFSNKQAARDGVYLLTFNGLTNGNQLVTTATTATTVVPFVPTSTTLPFQIGEDQSRIGDLDVTVGAGRVQIFGKGKDDSTTILGNPQARTVVDGNLTDRIFDLAIGANVAVSGVEMINGKVVYERSGGSFRNYGSLTLNDDDLLSSFADGNGGAIYNAAPFGLQVAVTGTLQLAALAGDASLTMNSVLAFPNTAPFVILIDSEQIQVTAVNPATNVFTVSRALNGTTATAHAAGSTVTLLSLTTLNRSTLQSNIAGSATSGSQYGKGGAIFNENGAVTINEGTYTANAAVTDGGALYNGNQATASLQSTTFTANLAGRDGGAIYNNDTALLTIRSSTLSNNRADAVVSGIINDLNGDGGAIYNETSAKLVLDDSPLQNNAARNGGALYNDDGTLVLNRDTFGVNSALENGGAIFNTSGGTLTLNQGLFTTNSASDNGGAIQNFGSLVILDVAGSGTQFLSNEAGTDVRPGDADNGKGAAIFNLDGTVSVSSATFTLNRSHGDAGVIHNDGDGTLTLRRTSFDRNSADGNGGVLVNNDFAQITIDEVTFSNNSADGDGGAIYNNSNFTSGATLSLTIDDTTLSSNAASRGGAIFNTAAGGLTMTNSTLSANSATVNGGGLANFGIASLLNGTLYLNDAPIGAGIANNLGGTPPFGPATLKNTLVAGGATGADIAGDNLVDGGHNLIEDVGTVTAFNNPLSGNVLGMNPQLDILRDNGGPTLTHALLFGSPARDAGDNFAVTLNDQRGLNRVFDGDGNGVATVDIGAFESGFVVNSFLDTVDENPGDGINADSNGQSTLRAAIMEANARPGEDTIILGPGIFTLTLTGRVEDFRLNTAGNIASSSETGDLDILDNLNIIGAGTDLTFINAAQLDRLFQIFPGVNLKLSNLTLQNGNATSTDFGGAIFNEGVTVLDNVLVINSSAGRGGGIYNSNLGTLTIEDSVFRGNQAVQQGGALYNDGTLTLTRTEIGAVSRLAAAIASSAASIITVSDSSDFPTSGPFVIQVDAERMLVTAVLSNQFTVTRGYNGTVATTHPASAFATLGNVANIHGGGLYNLGIASITQSAFSGNLAGSRGGGLYNAALSGALTAAINNVQTIFTLTTVAGFPTVGPFTIQIDSERMTVQTVDPLTNTLTVTRQVGGTFAAAHAAGALVTSVGQNRTTIQQSTFLDNFASSRGAAIFNEEELTIRNSTLSNNDSGTNAALGNTVSGQVTIVNSTVVDNVAYRGGGLSNSLVGTVNVQNTIVANNASTTITGAKAPNVRGTFATSGNNFIGNNADSAGFVNGTSFDQVGSGTSPFDPVLKTLANNGGPTQTHSARTGSPIIDAGNNTGGDPFDQRGAIRPTNADSDIGSVEQQDVHVSINDVSLREGNSGSTIFTFTLSLTKPSIQEIRVHYTLQGDTAFAGEDFADLSGDVVFAPNQLNQTLEVVVNGDTTIEPDEQFLVNLSVPANASFTPILDRTQAIGTIVSDDTGFRITDVNRVEKETGSADQDYVFSISVVGAQLSPNQTVSVDYTIVDGSATIAGGDYALVGAATGTFTFTAGPNGELPAAQILTVKVKGDEAVEANENFLVNLTAGAGVLPFEFDKSKGVGTIFNDDLSFSISNATANEGDPVSSVPMNFTVTLDRAVYVSGLLGVPTLATTTATVATASASATSGQDFTAVNTVLTFSGITTSQVVSVGIIGDLRFEVPSETFQLQVTAGTINGVSDGNVVGFSTSGTGTIVDNDPPPDQYHIYTQFNAGLGTNRIRVDRIQTVLGVPTRTNLLDIDQATAVPFTQVGDFGAVPTDDLFAVDFNLYDDTAAAFTQYDATGVIDPTHVLGTSNPIPVGGLSVDGLLQVGADAVRFQGGGTFNTVTYHSINSGSGSVDFDGSVVNYTGLEPLFDNTNADNRVFNAPVGASNDTILASASGGFISISGPTFESVTALAPTSSLILNGDGGNDTFQINSSDLTFTASLTVNAGDGNDNVNLSGWALTSTINGGAGTDTITGGSNADSIDGGDGNDTITGGLGGDTLLGGLGNDSIAAGGGDDFVNGGDDNDTIQGNDGIDTLSGGAGNDSVDGGAGSETVDGGSGDDTVTGGDGDDTVLGNDGNDSISGGTGNDSVDGGFGDDTMSGDAGNDTVNGQNGSDIFKYVDSTSGNINFTLTSTLFTSGSESDTLTNTERADILAGSGNNRIDASTFVGSVTMNGAGGNDTLLGGLGDDSLIGGLGTDTASGGSGNDTITGNDGNDTLNGDAGDDVITGDAGADSITAGAGNDNASGGAGNDVLSGGSGIDTLDGGDSQDTLTGGDDGDSILGGAGQDSINGDNGDDSIDGGDGDDTTFGDNGNDFVGGGAGNDTVEGNLGDDSVNGNDGNDTLDGNEGFDTLFGGAGDDELISTDGNDQLLGQGGLNDRFTFNGDAVLGDIFTITLAGNGFSPPTGIGLARLNNATFTTILLGVEIFTLNLNGGNDLVTLGDLNGVLDLTVLNINGGDGNDTIDGSLSTSTSVAIRTFLGLGNDSVQGSAASDTILGEAGNDTIIANSGADSVVGGDGNDSLNGNDGVDTINGSLGDDSILGGASGDSLIGFDGNDTIWGQGGNDTLDGGVGDDFLDGGYGNASATGTGNDSIRGGFGNDKIAGRDGLDKLFGDDGLDTITGGADNDSIDGGNGNDLVEGDAGNDTINGGAGNDFLLGGLGNDSILGGAGNDTLVGEDGNDTLDGQGGTDTVLGGNGTGTDTHAIGDKRIGEKINELFKLTTARPSIFNELNF